MQQSIHKYVVLFTKMENYNISDFELLAGVSGISHLVVHIFARKFNSIRIKDWKRACPMLKTCRNTRSSHVASLTHFQKQASIKQTKKVKLTKLLSVTLSTTSKDSGSYMCVATNQFNKTKVFISPSSEVVITIKG